MIRDSEIEELRRARYGSRQIEAILDSKWTRWAHESNMSILEWMKAHPTECSRERVRLLTEGKI